MVRSSGKAGPTFSYEFHGSGFHNMGQQPGSQAGAKHTPGYEDAEIVVEAERLPPKSKQ